MAMSFWEFSSGPHVLGFKSCLFSVFFQLCKMRIELSFFATTQPCPTSRNHSIYSYFPDRILPICLCVTLLSQVFDVYIVMVVYDI